MRFESDALGGSRLDAVPDRTGRPRHEGWGVVDAVGERVESLSVGNRVAVLSYKAYADYDIADADAAIALPDALAGQPFPGEPLGCAMNIFRRSDITAGQTVAIIGIGFLGAILTRLATAAGARVIAVSRRPFPLRGPRDGSGRDGPPRGSRPDRRSRQGVDSRDVLRPRDRSRESSGCSISLRN